MSVKAESIFEGLHIGALFQEGFLQPVSSSMEVLLKKKNREEQLRFIIFSRQTQTFEYTEIMATMFEFILGLSID